MERIQPAFNHYVNKAMVAEEAVRDPGIVSLDDGAQPPAPVRVPALMNSTLSLLITEKRKVVGTCLGTPKHPHNLTIT